MLRMLRKENERLINILKGEPLVKRINYEAGQPLDLAMSHPLVAAVASSLADLLRQTGATNYLEMRCHTQDEAFVVTIQRAFNKTPHQFRLEAEAECARLTKRVHELENNQREVPP